MDDYESVLLVKPEVFVYRIPPRTTNRGHRAADWSLGTPDWTGRMKLVVCKGECLMKLEDKITGESFAQSPIDKYPGVAIEAVTDSSRYFVIRIQNEGGQAAFIGLGFGDRSDSFDLNVALQDHFKWVRKDEEAEKDGDPKPALDLSFKEGQTIKINMKITKKDGQEGGASGKSKTKTAGGGLGILPPPPGGVKIAPPPGPSPQHQPNLQPSSGSNIDFLGNLDSSSNPKPATGESWGDFTSANTKESSELPPPANTGGGGGGWVTF